MRGGDHRDTCYPGLQDVPSPRGRPSRKDGCEESLAHGCCCWVTHGEVQPPGGHAAAELELIEDGRSGCVEPGCVEPGCDAEPSRCGLRRLHSQCGRLTQVSCSNRTVVAPKSAEWRGGWKLVGCQVSKLATSESAGPHKQYCHKVLTVALVSGFGRNASA